MGTILTRKPLRCKHFGASWERLGSLTGGESGIRTHGTVRVADNPLTNMAGMADRTSFAPETTSRRDSAACILFALQISRIPYVWCERFSPSFLSAPMFHRLRSKEGKSDEALRTYAFAPAE
jgi:hypothetical protein